MELKRSYRLTLLTTTLVLFLSTCVLFFEYRDLRMRTAAYRASLLSEHKNQISEVYRPYTPISQYSADIVFKPRLQNSPDYRLVVVSLSAGAYYKRRSAVRSTWYKQINSWNLRHKTKLMHYFVCFTPQRTAVNDDLLIEAQQYQDIIIFAERDNYSSLPVQTISALDFVHSYFRTDFVLKTDDDSLVNVDGVMRKLENSERDMFIGRNYEHRTPSSDGQKAWVRKYHPDQEKLEFPAFAPGAGYIIGSSILPNILQQTNLVELTDAEDVYMGEVVGQLDINITPAPGIFPVWQDFCNRAALRSPHWLIIHWLDPERMVRFWERLSSPSGQGGCHKKDLAQAQRQAKQGTLSRN